MDFPCIHKIYEIHGNPCFCNLAWHYFPAMSPQSNYQAKLNTLFVIMCATLSIVVTQCDDLTMVETPQQPYI